MEILDQFKQKKIGKGELLVWWLGGASFYIRSASNKIIIDPYLSNSVYELLKPFFKEPDRELYRLIDAPLKADEIECDYYICTHDHLDHLDPGTVEGLRNKENIKFIGPGSCCRHFLELGIPDKNIIKIRRDQTLTFDKDLIITAIPARHRGPLDVEASLKDGREVYGEDDGQGYIIRTGGVSLYHTSDTEYTNELNNLKDKGIDIVLLAANGKAGNLTPEEGIRLVKIIDPDIVIPMHHGVIPFTDADPEIVKELFMNSGVKSDVIIPNIKELFLYKK